MGKSRVAHKKLCSSSARSRLKKCNRANPFQVERIFISNAIFWVTEIKSIYNSAGKRLEIAATVKTTDNTIS